ncbi:hypothetical protein ATCC19435_0603 [Lactococcus lactis subsp. lactis]|nr:hypothetical protein ATCC19435_0603 [Lactococcus lactis subsp. lactis]
MISGVKYNFKTPFIELLKISNYLIENYYKLLNFKNQV